VRTHPTIQSLICFAVMDYALPNDPRFRPFFVTKNEEGEEVNLFFVAPKTTEDLLRGGECFVAGAV
jgi:aromatic ring hydroxylase